MAWYYFDIHFGPSHQSRETRFEWHVWTAAEHEQRLDELLQGRRDAVITVSRVKRLPAKVHAEKRRRAEVAIESGYQLLAILKETAEYQPRCPVPCAHGQCVKTIEHKGRHVAGRVNRKRFG